jgi:hypothetical protein
MKKLSADFENGLVCRAGRGQPQEVRRRRWGLQERHRFDINAVYGIFSFVPAQPKCNPLKKNTFFISQNGRKLTKMGGNIFLHQV